MCIFGKILKVTGNKKIIFHQESRYHSHCIARQEFGYNGNVCSHFNKTATGTSLFFNFVLFAILIIYLFMQLASLEDDNNEIEREAQHLMRLAKDSYFEVINKFKSLKYRRKGCKAKIKLAKHILYICGKSMEMQILLQSFLRQHIIVLFDYYQYEKSRNLLTNTIQHIERINFKTNEIIMTLTVAQK